MSDVGLRRRRRRARRATTAAGRTARPAGAAASSLLAAEGRAPVPAPAAVQGAAARRDRARRRCRWRTADWYAERGDRDPLGPCARALDPDGRARHARRTATSSPTTRCVLATGAEPVRPPVPGADARRRAHAAHASTTRSRSASGPSRARASSSRLRVHRLRGRRVAARRGAARSTLLSRGARAAGGAARRTRSAARLAGWLDEAGVERALRRRARARSSRGDGALRVDGLRRRELDADLVLLAGGVAPRRRRWPRAAGLALADDGEVAPTRDAHRAPRRPGLRRLPPRPPRRRRPAAARRALGRRARPGRGRRARRRRRRRARGTPCPASGRRSATRTLKYAAWGDGFDEVRVCEHGDGAFTAWYGAGGVLRRRAHPRPRRRLRRRPRLHRAGSAAAVTAAPGAVVVVPARDEAQRIGALPRARSAAQRGVAPERVRDRRRARPLHRRHARRGARPPPRDRPGRAHRRRPRGRRRIRAPARDGLACAPPGEAGARRPDRQHRRRHDARRRTGSPRSSRSPRAGAEAIGGAIVLADDEADGARPGGARRGARRAPGRASTPSSPATRRAEHHFFSGASMAVTARAYGSVGGLEPLPALEDEAFEARLERAGVPITRSAAVRVATAARTDGRAARGLARDLELGEWLARRRYDGARLRPATLRAAQGRRRRSPSSSRPASARRRSAGVLATAVVPFAEAGLVDQVVVVDGASRDGTAERAARAGARGPAEDELLPGSAPRAARATRCGGRWPRRRRHRRLHGRRHATTPTPRTCSASSARCSATRASTSSRPRSSGRSGRATVSSPTRAAASRS